MTQGNGLDNNKDTKILLQQQRDKDTFTIYLFVILVYYRSYYSFKVLVKDLIVTLLIS